MRIGRRQANVSSRGSLFGQGMGDEEFKIVGVNDHLIAGDSQGTTFKQVIPRDIIVISLVVDTGLLINDPVDDQLGVVMSRGQGYQTRDFITEHIDGPSTGGTVLSQVVHMG
jgi:hypothetical protein